MKLALFLATDVIVLADDAGQKNGTNAIIALVRSETSHACHEDIFASSVRELTGSLSPASPGEAWLIQ